MDGYKGVETASLSEDNPPDILIWSFRFMGSNQFHKVRRGKLEEYLSQFPDNKLNGLMELHREVLK
jgi:hypothetical protein